MNAQLIRQSGIFHYTYTVTGVAGCTDNSAEVTVTIGGYSGVTSPNVSVCSSVKSFNLFQAFSGLSLAPQSNGQWHNDTNNVDVRNVINVDGVEGTYQFTYTMPAIGTCPAVSSTAVITIFKAPESGVAKDLLLCASNGLSGYTNYDLFSALSGQDSGGVWRDVNARSTGELTSLGDHVIDVQKIYDRFGQGDFYFTYTVASTNPICQDVQSTVRVHLEDKLDFTGATMKVNDDICETEIPNATYSVRINKGPAAIPNGSYYVTFRVSGPNGGTERITATFNNGVISFFIRPDYFQQAGIFNVNILSIIPTNSAGICNNIINNLSDDLIIYAIPDLAGAQIPESHFCQNADALVQISNATKVTNGTYEIRYNLSGANTVFNQVAQATFSGGNASFTVPAIFNTNTGTTQILITTITHVASRCGNTANLTGNLIIDPLPDLSSLIIRANDICTDGVVTAVVSGFKNLTDVTLSYTLSGSNVAGVQVIPLTITNNSASFVIPSNLIPNTGSTTISVTNLVNNVTNCGVNVSGTTDEFVITAYPAAPVAGNQEFCKIDQSTIANLVPNGNQYKWYDSATATTPLAATELLTSGNYYLRETTGGCTSDPTMITVTINDTPAPVLNQDGQNFCGLDNPTIANLSNNTNESSTIVWYDAPNNGNLLPSTTLLADKAKYYGFDVSTVTRCISSEYIEVAVSLIDCDSPEYTFFVPDGFSPNGDGINDTFTIPDIDFLYPNYSLEIFNRYGNGMYKGFKNKPAWDGINYEQSGIGGGIAPNGVYFYILYFNKDNRPPQQGRLYLNR
ncbi:MAG: T9SS type B sorting domain-containing protein [Flavobacterium sp.]|nr:MAG: T9SS type B sorting domain-containing protein [Flavobacterium sp.]